MRKWVSIALALLCLVATGAGFAGPAIAVQQTPSDATVYLGVPLTVTYTVTNEASQAVSITTFSEGAYTNSAPGTVGVAVGGSTCSKGLSLAAGQSCAYTLTLTGQRSGTATIGQYICAGGCIAPSTSVSVIDLQSIAVTPSTSTIAVNGTQQFTATGTYSVGSSTVTKTIPSPNWNSSSSTSVASIASTGLATGLGVGSTNITASVGNVTSKPVALNVTAPLSVTLTPPSPATVVPGESSGAFSVSVSAAGNNQPTTADYSVNWGVSSVSNSNYTISDGGVVTAPANANPGDVVTVTATVAPTTGSNYTAPTGSPPSAQLDVVSPTIGAITVTPPTSTISVNKSLALTATSMQANGKQGSSLGSNATWAVTPSSGVASVDSSGNVTGLGAGSATVTATYNGQSGTATVNVTSSFTVAVNPTKASLTAGSGKDQDFSVVVTDVNNNTVPDTDYTVKWTVPAVITHSVSNNKVTVSVPATATLGPYTLTATVTPNSGSYYTGTGQGSATLTATSPKVGEITVTSSPTSTIKLTYKNSLQFTATATQSDGTQGPSLGSKATWSVTPSTIASVDSSGKVTGLVAGSATVTATYNGQNGTAPVTVISSVSNTGVTVNAPTAALIPGQPSDPFTVTVLDINKNTVPVTDYTVTWTAPTGFTITPSASTLTATVTAPDSAAGTDSNSITAIIFPRASYGDQSISSSAKVTVATPSSISVALGSASVDVGGKTTVTATAIYPNATNQQGNNITNLATWSSTPSSSVTISNGALTAGATPGAVTVTAGFAGLTSKPAPLTVQAKQGGTVTVSAPSAPLIPNKASGAFSVIVTDPNKNAVPSSNYTVAWSAPSGFTITPSASTLTATVTASSSVANTTSSKITATVTPTGPYKNMGTLYGTASLNVGIQNVLTVTLNNGPQNISALAGSSATYDVEVKANNSQPLALGNDYTLSSTCSAVDTPNALACSVSGNSISVSVPSGGAVPGAYTVTVSVSGAGPIYGGLTATGTAAVNVTPTITSISPALGSIKGGDTVTISGSGFSSPASVSFSQAGTTTIVGTPTSTSIKITTPPSTSESLNNVSVTVNGQTATITGGFQYVTPIVVNGTSVDPGAAKAPTIPGLMLQPASYGSANGSGSLYLYNPSSTSSVTIAPPQLPGSISLVSPSGTCASIAPSSGCTLNFSSSNISTDASANESISLAVKYNGVSAPAISVPVAPINVTVFSPPVQPATDKSGLAASLMLVTGCQKPQLLVVQNVSSSAITSISATAGKNLKKPTITNNCSSSSGLPASQFCTIGIMPTSNNAAGDHDFFTISYGTGSVAIPVGVDQGGTGNLPLPGTVIPTTNGDKTENNTVFKNDASCNLAYVYSGNWNNTSFNNLPWDSNQTPQIVPNMTSDPQNNTLQIINQVTGSETQGITSYGAGYCYTRQQPNTNNLNWYQISLAEFKEAIQYFSAPDGYKFWTSDQIMSTDQARNEYAVTYWISSGNGGYQNKTSPYATICAAQQTYPSTAYNPDCTQAASWTPGGNMGGQPIEYECGGAGVCFIGTNEVYCKSGDNFPVGGNASPSSCATAYKNNCNGN